MACTVVRIVSGGLCGAEVGALQAARDLGLATGGFASRGYRTQGGARPELREWGLVELATDSCAARIRANVGIADAVAVLTVFPASPGTRLTVKHAQRLGKPLVIIDPWAEGTARRLRAFTAAHRPAVLMVTGNRETAVPESAARVRQLVGEALRGTNSNCTNLCVSASSVHGCEA